MTFRRLLHHPGVLLIELPPRRVVVDVLANLCQRLFAAHDVLEVIPLPEGSAGEPMRTIDPFRADSLECANQTSQGLTFAVR